jgi:hypothetical protein
MIRGPEMGRSAVRKDFSKNKRQHHAAILFFVLIKNKLSLCDDRSYRGIIPDEGDSVAWIYGARTEPAFFKPHCGDEGGGVVVRDRRMVVRCRAARGISGSHINNR